MSAAPRPSTRKQRAASAYDAVAAWREPARQQIRRAVFTRAINEPTGNFLHWLLGRYDDKPYCAIPKDELATLYGKSLSSIKLYVREGVANCILRVSGRRIYFVQLEAPEVTSMSYEQLVEEATALAEAGNLIDAGLLLRQAAEVRKQAAAQAEETPEDQPAERSAEAEPEPFFCGTDESKNCPDSDNSLSDDPLKTPSSGGDEKKDRESITLEIFNTPTVKRLRALGSTAPKCWAELHDRPFAEIEYAAQQAQQAQWADDKPAATIYFIRLLRDRVISLPTDQAAPPAASESPPSAAPPDAPGDSGDLWTQVQAALREQLPYGEFETWIKATSLIQVAEQQAIVGTPNIFARDKLTETYAPLIADTLGTLLGCHVQLAVVLDTRLAYGGGG